MACARVCACVYVSVSPCGPSAPLRIHVMTLCLSASSLIIFTRAQEAYRDWLARKATDTYPKLRTYDDSFDDVKRFGKVFKNMTRRIKVDTRLPVRRSVVCLRLLPSAFAWTFVLVIEA